MAPLVVDRREAICSSLSPLATSAMTSRSRSVNEAIWSTAEMEDAVDAVPVLEPFREVINSLSCL